jgi:hypothetical protein
MARAVSKSTIAPPDIGVVSVERLEGYLVLLDAILRVLRQAKREEESRSPRNCEVMLAMCRRQFGGHLKQIDHPYQTTWEMGVFYLIELLWETINPVFDVSDAELLGRVQKAHRIAGALEKMLSALFVLESFSSVDVEEALERLHADDDDIPF